MILNFAINYYSVSLFIGGFVALLSGAVVFLNDRKSFTNWSWLLLNISSSIWSFAYFLMITAGDVISGYRYNVILHWGAICIPFFYFLFILGITKTLSRFRTLAFVIGTIALFFSVINQSLLFVDKVLPKFVFNYAPNAGPFYIYFTIYFFSINIIAGLILLEKILKNKDSKEASQLKQILFSSAAGFIGGGSVFFLTFNINLPPYPIILFALYPIIIAYAISKYNLFNVKLIATELLIFSIWLILTVKMVLTQSFYDQLIDATLLLITIVLGIFLIRSVLKEVKQREEIEKLASQLTAANARLKELDKLKSEFVSIASHQLRSPLTAIKGYASLILDGSYGKITYGVHEAVNKIFQSSVSLVIMVEDFLSISRIEQGTMKYNLETIDIEELIKTVVGEQEANVERVGLKISFSTDKKPPYLVSIDINKIRQVITNLIDNSVKYTPKGSISVRLYKEPSRNKIMFSISDTGVGIDKETIPQLFAKFSRAKDANKVNVVGTGLGLYIVKEIIMGHKGRVSVTSEGKGKGSNFFVELDENLDAARVNRVNEFAKSV